MFLLNAEMGITEEGTAQFIPPLLAEPGSVWGMLYNRLTY